MSENEQNEREVSQWRPLFILKNIKTDFVLESGHWENIQYEADFQRVKQGEQIEVTQRQSPIFSKVMLMEHIAKYYNYGQNVKVNCDTMLLNMSLFWGFAVPSLFRDNKRKL